MAKRYTDEAQSDAVRMATTIARQAIAKQSAERGQQSHVQYRSKFAGDISDIWTSEGWLYLAVILDLYSRRVIGWAVSNRMKRDLAIRALDMAVALRRPVESAQYCSGEYHEACPSMGSRSQ